MHRLKEVLKLRPWCLLSPQAVILPLKLSFRPCSLAWRGICSTSFIIRHIPSDISAETWGAVTGPGRGLQLPLPPRSGPALFRLRSISKARASTTAHASQLQTSLRKGRGNPSLFSQTSIRIQKQPCLITIIKKEEFPSWRSG